MTNLEGRIVNLEQQLRQNALLLATIQAQIAAAQQATRTGQQSPFPGAGGGGSIYEMTGVVIAAGGNVTGQTVKQRVGATVVTTSANATVYNDMGQPTIASNLIILSLNPDGSFTVVTQSC